MLTKLLKESQNIQEIECFNKFKVMLENILIDDNPRFDKEKFGQAIYKTLIQKI
jgi:hypothetical protein